MTPLCRNRLVLLNITNTLETPHFNFHFASTNLRNTRGGWDDVQRFITNVRTTQCLKPQPSGFNWVYFVVETPLSSRKAGFNNGCNPNTQRLQARLNVFKPPVERPYQERSYVCWNLHYNNAIHDSFVNTIIIYYTSLGLHMPRKLAYLQIKAQTAIQQTGSQTPTLISITMQIHNWLTYVLQFTSTSYVIRQGNP